MKKFILLILLCIVALPSMAQKQTSWYTSTITKRLGDSFNSKVADARDLEISIVPKFTANQEGYILFNICRDKDPNKSAETIWFEKGKSRYMYYLNEREDGTKDWVLALKSTDFNHTLIITYNLDNPSGAIQFYNPQDDKKSIVCHFISSDAGVVKEIFNKVARQVKAFNFPRASENSLYLDR